MALPKWLCCVGLLLVLLLSSPVCSADTVEQTESSWRWFDLRSSQFIPIPEVGTDPNSGTTVGLLPIYLVTDPSDGIRQIIAPDFTYNPALGYGGHFRIFGYPSEDTQWYAVAGAKQVIERVLDASYTTGLTRREPWSLSGRLVYDRSATARFYGIGNDTPLANRTNFTDEQAFVEASVGWNITPAWQLALQMRPRVVAIDPGILEQSIPSPFLGSKSELLNRLLVTYDTRDSVSIPSRGSRVVLFAGVADRHLLSTGSYSIVGVDSEHVAPVGDRLTLAAHAALRYMPEASNVPFWALSTLGGDRSIVGEQQPLRGFGEGRFVDRNLFSATVELRARAFDLNLFSTDISFEPSPFIDVGRVFHDLSDNPIGRLHLVGGLGLRAVARPFIVGYVDVGYGSEGVAIFSGINYPF